MLYHVAILGKKGPLSLAWLAAFRPDKLSRAQILAIDIVAHCRAIEAPPIPLALRTEAHLIKGLVVILNRKTELCLKDCQNVLVLIKASRKSMLAASIDLPENRREAPRSAIELPEQYLAEDLFDGLLDVPPNVDFDLNLNLHTITLPEATSESAQRPVDLLDQPVIDDGFGRPPGQPLDDDDLLWGDMTFRERASGVEPTPMETDVPQPDQQQRVQPLLGDEEMEDLTQIIPPEEIAQPRETSDVPPTQPPGEPLILGPLRDVTTPRRKQRPKAGPRHHALVSTPRGLKRRRIESGPVVDETTQISLRTNRDDTSDITYPHTVLAPSTRELMNIRRVGTVGGLFNFPASHYVFGSELARYSRERIFTNQQFAQSARTADDRRHSPLDEAQEQVTIPPCDRDETEPFLPVQPEEEIPLPPTRLDDTQDVSGVPERGRDRGRSTLGDVSAIPLREMTVEDSMRRDQDMEQAPEDTTLPAGGRPSSLSFFDPRPSFTQQVASDTQEDILLQGEVRSEILTALDEVEDGGRIPFSQYTSGFRRRKAAQIFAQLLVLYKDELVKMEQSENFAEIYFFYPSAISASQ